jgi:hypothetical protein
MNITCILLSTAKRIQWLNKSIESIDSLDFKFDEKIISVDEFDGFTISDSDVKHYLDNGWIVDRVSFKNKHAAIKKAVDLSKGDFIFYAEDDIIINKIPPDIKEILSIEKEGKICGVLSMNLGGSKLDYPRHLGDMPYWLENIIYEKDNLITFMRLESEASKWFIEFPSVFFNKELMSNLLDTTMIQNNVIEETLTSNFFNNSYNKKYYKASICYDKIKEVISLLSSNNEVYFWNEKLESVKLYKLLDQNQGGANINLNEIKYVQ